MVETKRTLIFIDEKTFPIYKKLMKSKYFKNNLHLFTCAVLVGKFIIKHSKSIDKKKDYIKVNDNRNDDNLTILKCLAISDEGKVNILNNEDELFEYCEKYANLGIHEIYNWYKDPECKFNQKLAEVLLGFWEYIDVNSLKNI